jgi:hypothetical protein
MAIAFNNQNNSIGLGSTNSSGFTTSITINSTGVGIGTTNPTAKLWVNGSGYFIGSVTSEEGFYVNGELIGSGSITGGNIVGTGLSVSGISTFSGDATFINDTGIKFGGIGNTSIAIKYNSTTNSLDFVVVS